MCANARKGWDGWGRFSQVWLASDCVEKVLMGVDKLENVGYSGKIID